MRTGRRAGPARAVIGVIAAATFAFGAGGCARHGLVERSDQVLARTCASQWARVDGSRGWPAGVDTRWSALQARFAARYHEVQGRIRVGEFTRACTDAAHS